MKKIILCLTILLIVGCTNSADAQRTLDSAGYTDIHILGYSFFACSQDDFYHIRFTATNYQGKAVKGTVCSGLLFKDATIRF